MFHFFKTIGQGITAILVSLNVISVPVPQQAITPQVVAPAVQEQTIIKTEKPPSITKAASTTQPSSNKSSVEKRNEISVAHDIAIQMLNVTINSSKPFQMRQALVKALTGSQLSSAELSLFDSSTQKLISSGNTTFIQGYLGAINNDITDSWNNHIGEIQKRVCDLNTEVPESERSFCHSLFSKDIRTKTQVKLPTPAPSVQAPQQTLPTIRTIDCTANSFGSQTNVNCYGLY